MIPQNMQSFLRKHLPASTWQNRLLKDGSLRFMEFSSMDVERLARLGIEVDKLGPSLVVCMWDEASDLEIGGYLVVDNLAMGRPSMGGIRMLPDVTPSAIHNLARGMTLKNAAADLPYGGGKSGIVGKPDLSQEEHNRVVSGFARLLSRYTDIYLPGPDVGTNDADMMTVAIQNGMDHALSKPVEMGGNRIDQLGAAAGGVIIALEALLEEMPRLKILPQFANLDVPSPEQVAVLIQGFGAVGAHAARILQERMPRAKVTGLSDATGYLLDPFGLPIKKLFQMWQERGLVTRPFFLEKIQAAAGIAVSYEPSPVKYSSEPNDLLRESAFCLIPAAPLANYLDTEASSKPCMTIDRRGKWDLIVEGANTYSPDPARKAARMRMERAVYREGSTLIATDYLVNSGGVIFAAQEHLIKTPQALRIPKEMLGDRQGVEKWLDHHAESLHALAQKRLEAAQSYRENVIRRNMRELVDLLISDADMLPGEAAERISIRRIATREGDRTAAEIMEPIPTIPDSSCVKDAAILLVQASCPILAVVNAKAELEGVVSEWDITRATAMGSPDDQPLQEIMTREVIAVCPTDSILTMIRKLEYHEISAMPVVEAGSVLGMVSADLLARRSLLRLLQSQLD
jgi:glutamate dehydrogenase/leucine dehydrogenase